MNSYSDELLRQILKRSRTFLCVGISANPIRPSYFVGRYLSTKGYRVIPVNPAYSGTELFGSIVAENLEMLDCGIKVDVIDIFRRSEEVPAIVEKALVRFPDLETIWMQIGVQNSDAARLAELRGKTVIQNRCPKIEHQRLYGELRMAGMNTGILSSRL